MKYGFFSCFLCLNVWFEYANGVPCVEVNMSQDPDGVGGTMYAVSIPVMRVKPDFDVENETYGWDEEPIEYDDNAWDKAA